MNKILWSRRGMIKRFAGLLGATCASFTPGWLVASEQKSPYKIGVVDWELTKPADPEALVVAAKLGFDGLQVDLGDVEGMKKPELQNRYEQLTRKYRIQIASLALGKLSDAPYGTDPKGQALVDSAIEVAKSMNQKILLLAFFGRNGLDREENKMDALVGRFKENAPKAEKCGVTLGIEGEASADKYRQIVEKVDSPAVKVYFDCVHAHEPGKDIYQEITSLRDKICEFHAKDYGNIFFGQGKIDFAQVRKAMDAIGYRGWIMMEQWGEVSGEKPLGFEETHRRNLRYLREVFGAKS